MSCLSNNINKVERRGRKHAAVLRLGASGLLLPRPPFRFQTCVAVCARLCRLYPTLPAANRTLICFLLAFFYVLNPNLLFSLI